jgi:hypothetical protein
LQRAARGARGPAPGRVAARRCSTRTWQKRTPGAKTPGALVRSTFTALPIGVHAHDIVSAGADSWERKPDVNSRRVRGSNPQPLSGRERVTREPLPHAHRTQPGRSRPITYESAARLNSLSCLSASTSCRSTSSASSLTSRVPVPAAPTRSAGHELLAEFFGTVRNG